DYYYLHAHRSDNVIYSNPSNLNYARNSSFKEGFLKFLRSGIGLVPKGTCAFLWKSNNDRRKKLDGRRPNILMNFGSNQNFGKFSNLLQMYSTNHSIFKTANAGFDYESL
ncbi:hypothetical protein Tcan_00832, partial [Toxocara canis]